MTTLVHETPRPAPAAGDGTSATDDSRLDRTELGVTEARVRRAEWVKFRSVRSNKVSVAAAVAVAVGLGAIFSSSGAPDGPRRSGTDPVSLSLAGFRLSQLIIGVIGVLFVTSEYSTGMIRSTFAAVRSRGSVLRAKLAVITAVTMVTGTVAAFAAYAVGQTLTDGVTSSLSDSGVLRAVIGTAVYTTAVAVLGVALGFLIRSTAAAVGVLFASLLLIPVLFGLLPWSWAETFTKLLPSNAGEAFTSVTSSSTLLSPGRGALVVGLWVVGLVGAAAAVLRRRDA